jgi:hypothetical protein
MRLRSYSRALAGHRRKAVILLLLLRLVSIVRHNSTDLITASAKDHSRAGIERGGVSFGAAGLNFQNGGGRFSLHCAEPVTAPRQAAW